MLDFFFRREGKKGEFYLYWFELVSQAGTPLWRAVTPPPSRKLIATAFYDIHTAHRQPFFLLCLSPFPFLLPPWQLLLPLPSSVFFRVHSTYPIPIITLPRSIEIRHQIHLRDRIARIAVHGIRIQNPARLIRAVWIRGPQIGQRGVISCEREVDELRDPVVLGAVGRGVAFADCLGAVEDF